MKTSAGEKRVTSADVLETGKWMHLAATIDKSGIGKLYKNGQLIQSGQLQLPETINRTQNYIGKSNWSNDGYFDGQMSEIRVWNVARSQEQIQQQMHSRLIGNEVSLVGYWPLNEGAGTTVADNTGNGQNGTINGATWQQQLIPIKPIQPIKKQGKIVVDADEWTLSNQGFQQAPDAAIFATNVAKWFTGGRGNGKFHAYSTNFGLTESALAQTLIKAGYTWTTGTSIQFDLPTLLNYDGIFVAGNAVDNKVLIEYVNAGGNVYLMAGTGVGGSQQEAERWNTFLNAFGLKLLGQYNGISGKQAVNSSHPIFAGVKSLYHNNGNSIVDLAPESPENQLVLTHANGQGLIAVFEGKQVKPAQINLPTNSRIKLKSWKGDYLHRPDSPQDVTSWNTGIGNEWIVEVIDDNKIKLKSWKGDYLHRPDSPQGVTTWNTGIGNEWIVEFIGDNKIKLKSWKGDYLHRPDSPQGVTSWHTGIGNEWFLEVISSGNAEGVLVKQGPKGGSIAAKDFEFLPKNSAPKSRIKTVSMMVAWAIGTLQVEYEDVGSSPAEIYSTTSVGSGGGNKVQVSLAPGDYITKITGSWGRQAPGYPKEEIITLQFETQKGVKSQVFGGGSGKQEVEPFVFEAPAGHEIIGFFGAHGGPQDLLIRLGVYSRPVEVISTPSQPQPETPTAIAPQPQPQPQPKPQPETPTAIAPQPQPETPTTEAEPEPTAVATGDVFISQIFYKGKIKRTQDDEYIEISNKGTTPADLSGWRVTSAGSNKQIFTFAKGTLLQPGKSFRVYSNQVHPESGGFSFGSSTALWKDSGDEGKLFDAQGNNVSTWAYGTNSIAGIKAELGVPQLVVEASPSAIIRQTALGGKVTFTEALKLALRSFLEDVNDIGSPLSLMLDNPGGYDGLPPNADKATTMKVLRSYVNQPNAKIILYSAKRGHELEGGETTETSWIFELIADQINSEQHWAIVDRAGEKAPYNYCVG
ncbi:hypothetical protein NIES2100_52940 [Calothrix sp. NIES-2100]|uniref:lamin tail domain-containing protein n=1 Tax=Calothrix sp. NIES-2100 TaxID=1954172 RepID=UPI000B5F09E1|nr:hypothetical protein NIES2100_52940 [Calothrix sp. NIES-2100]